MKVAILGYSGSGKSTLAQLISKAYGLDTLHFDTVQFLPNWEIRDPKEKERITKEFLDSHDSWVIDGNYSKLYFERRMAEADTIILLLFNRFTCLKRAFSRYLRYKNTTRPDMAVGCNEKFDMGFAKWILWKGRMRKDRERYRNVIAQYPEKVTVIKNQRQLNRYISSVIAEKSH